MLHQRSFAVLTTACAAALTLAGCASGGQSAGAPGGELAVGHVRGLGPVLVDGDGQTLYLYVPDARGRSRCYGICASQWPPVLASQHPKLGPGVERAMVGEVRRRNGAEQVTYDGWPLYRWRFDTTPGQATGEGKSMGLWWAVSPSGHEVR